MVCSRARGSQERMQELQAFTDELSFGLARVLGSNLASGTQGLLEVTARHEIVTRILWRKSHGIALDGLVHI
ncbi:hypothetical protein NPS42_14860 [Pseudomonas putida]|uniref:hypothetical protein n=1 Tax=Pseudomonas putida TaxID=303 RepID=UPI0023641407|nr:hypothetical protein [Pseudomonas putida]MDD2027072.1 hypothetical protein [Pseudomonas putida]HDS1765667.1 hypothetical protein [Pseudomonas putida]